LSEHDATAHTNLSIVPNNGSVDQQCQQGVLVGGGVFFQQSFSIVVTDGGAFWALSRDRADGRNSPEQGDSVEVHFRNTGLPKECRSVAMSECFGSGERESGGLSMA